MRPSGCFALRRWAFVPFTAAGQRGNCTPLPLRRSRRERQLTLLEHLQISQWGVRVSLPAGTGHSAVWFRPPRGAGEPRPSPRCAMHRHCAWTQRNEESRRGDPHAGAVPCSALHCNWGMIEIWKQQASHPVPRKGTEGRPPACGGDLSVTAAEKNVCPAQVGLLARELRRSRTPSTPPQPSPMS